MQSTDDLLGSPAFLSWLPGETLFSLVSRHHYFSGHVLSARTCKQFFGHERAGSQHDLPSRLCQFVARTRGCFGSVEQVATQNTLLSYYAAFVSPDETENAIAAMAGHSVVHLKFRLGILTSRFRANHPLKACEACMEEDRARFGWAYWHLDHQFPGVWTCHKHDRLLRESALKATGVERFQWHLPAQESFFNWRSETNRAAQSDLGALTSLSRLVLDLVSPTCPSKLDTGRLHEVYRVELSRRGWLTEGGNLRMPALAASYLEHVRHLRVLPELGALPSTLDGAVTQLGRMLRPPRSGTHPLRHLVLINWLFGSADVFWATYDLALHRSALLASGSHPREDALIGDVRDPRRQQLVDLLSVQKMSMRRAAMAVGIDVGTAMAWSAKEGLANPRRPKKLVHDVRRKLIAELKMGVDKSIAAHGAGVSVGTITKLLLSEVGLHAIWCQARQKLARTAARSDWEDLLQTHAGLGIKLMRSLKPAAYAWLYRHDRAWLDNHKPGRTAAAATPGLPRVLWDARDEALSAEIRRAVHEMRRSAGTRRLKLWELCQAVPSLKPKLTALGRLPLTRRAIEQALRSRGGDASESDLFG